MLEFAVWNAWMTASSNVFWNVEPEPFNVVLHDDQLLEGVPLEPLLLELPQAPATKASVQTTMSVRLARLYNNCAFTIGPLAVVASMSTLRTTHGCIAALG